MLTRWLALKTSRSFHTLVFKTYILYSIFYVLWTVVFFVYNGANSNMFCYIFYIIFHFISFRYILINFSLWYSFYTLGLIPSSPSWPLASNQCNLPDCKNNNMSSPIFFNITIYLVFSKLKLWNNVYSFSKKILFHLVIKR